jgi:hypothetical protein
VQRLHIELRLCLHLDEAHSRSRRRLGYALGISIVVFLRLE